MLDDLKPVLDPGFLDCGAHSVETGVWKELPIDDYVQWTKANHRRFKIIAVPDEIGDPEKTKVQTLQFAKDVKGVIPEKKLLPIYHMQTKNIDAYRDMLDYADKIGAEWVAIGGALGVGFTPMQKRVALEGIFSYLPRDRFKIHLLGITEPDIVQDFAPDSVDSSKYVWEGSYLNIFKYQPDYRSRYRESLRDKSNESILRRACEEIYLNNHLLGNRFSSVDEVQEKLLTIPDSIRVILANGLHLVEFERVIREKVNKNFRHYVTCGTGHLRLYSGLTLEIFQTIWKERALVAFPQFHGKTSTQVRHDLSVFNLTE